MKKLYKYIVLVFGILAFSACTDEISFPSVVIEEGRDVTLNLNFQLKDNDLVESRTAATAKENQLFDLHFYVFNSNGDLTGYKTIENDNIPTPGKDESTKITINAKSGANSTIYALANIKESETYYLDKEQITRLTNPVEEQLTESELLSMRYNRISASEGKNYSPTPSGEVFIMSGYLNDGAPVNIDKNGNVTGGDGVIKLYRLLAKNVLMINTFSVNKTDDKGNVVYDPKTKEPIQIYNGQFLPRSYRFYNVPTGGMLIPNKKISTANETYEYSSNISYQMQNKDSIESNYVIQTNDSTLIFYFPESLQSVISDVNIWKDREKNEWNKTTNVKTYKKAPACAGYIEIQGDYVNRKVENGKIVEDITADVTYTIHLGNFSKNKIESNVKYGDFNIVRNNLYKYKVIVNGVEDIKAEAIIVDANDKDDNPYAEGLVIDAIGSTHLNVDAHYEARVMTFKKSVIDNIKNNNGNAGYFLNIKTPFWQTSNTYNVRGDAVYLGSSKECVIDKLEDNGSPFKGGDYKWVKFVQNTNDRLPAYAKGKDNAIRDYPCMYPGDGDDDTRQWLNVFELLAQLYNTTIESSDCVYKTQVPVIDPETGIQMVDKNGNKVFDYEAYYTCFIDENYYPERAWTEYVNKSPRTMLIANKLDVSEDGKSLYAKVEYGISQRSIATFYLNKDKIAFGTEIYDEEELFGNELGASGSDTKRYGNYKVTNKPIRGHQDWNARSSAVASNAYIEGGNTEVSWYGNLDTNDIYDNKAYINDIKFVQPLYTAVAKACMSRNRDTNGDGNIDKDEVKWYLASVGQYRALYFAQNVLPVDARLINNADLTAINTIFTTKGWSDTNGHDDRGDYHYWTCSAGNAATFWPEEGLTNNPVGPVNPGSWVSRAELVRCVRTLKSYDPGLEEPQKYYTVEKEPVNYNTNTKKYRDTIYTFIMDGIKVNRKESNNPLPVHHELNEENDFTSKFVVAVNDLSGGTRTIQNITNLTSDYCQNYKNDSNKYDDNNYKESNYEWRTPNQKEFALMYAEVAELKNSSNVYGMRTQFSGSDKSEDENGWRWHDKWGFAGDGGRINLNSNSANLRCVRDFISNQ